MLEAHKKRMNISVGVWFVFILVQIVLKKSGYEDSALLSLAYIASTIAMIVACYSQAVGKGQSGVWALLGIFNILGFIVLALFPDKHKA